MGSMRVKSTRESWVPSRICDLLKSRYGLKARKLLHCPEASSKGVSGKETGIVVVNDMVKEGKEFGGCRKEEEFDETSSTKQCK